jgi:hypothetical protein
LGAFSDTSHSISGSASVATCFAVSNGWPETLRSVTVPLAGTLDSSKSDRDYRFRIEAVSEGATHASDDYVIHTGPPTDAVALGAFTVHDEAAMERGFIVTSYWSGGGASGGSGTNVPFIIDADGEIVWWYRSHTNSIARARMSEDGRNMWMVISGLEGAPLERVAMDTLEGQTYTATTGSHDLTPVEGDLMAYLDYSESDCDSIFEIDPSGATEEVFESQDYVVEGAGLGGCHSNAIRYSKTEDVYTFSDLHQDIFIVNRAGGVDWRLSERVSGRNNAWGGANHGHQLLDNSILIFANNGGANASAAIEYTLDGEEIMRYDSGYETGNLGDVQRLPGGNTLVTYANDGVIQEIDENESLVLQIESNRNRIGYTDWRGSLYGPPPDIGM